MKINKKIEKKYVDELKDEYDRIVEIKGNRLMVVVIVTLILTVFLLALKYGLITIK